MFKIYALIISSFLICPVVFASDFAINVSWFENFNDEILTSYIEDALTNNKDVEIAKKNILKYRQDKNLKIADEFPEIDVGANYLLLKVPKLAIPNNDIQKNSFALPFMAFWEIDWLLKNYNKIQKARLDVEEAYINLKASNLLVATDVADAYFNISNLEKRLELQNNIVTLLENIFKRKKKMFEYGVISILELNEYENVLYEAKNDIEKLEKERGFYLTELAYMLGKSPYNLDELKVKPFDEIDFTGNYPKSLTGDIVINRPDIMKLECELKKANLDVTIAKKDFLPRINVFGILVFSTIVQNFGWDGVFAALSVGAVQNLFDGGKRIFTLKKRKIECEKAYEEYLKADISALKEVNDALYTLKKDFEIYENNKSRLNLAQDNFIKIFNSYKNGAKSEVDYFDENERYLKSDINLVQSKNQNFINLINLFKTTGGAL